jgi:phosphodiesterase/alkaline phosphatase D-like protein
LQPDFLVANGDMIYADADCPGRFVVTDVHNAQSMRYSLDAHGDGDQLVFHEFVTAPLSAVKVAPVSPTRP